jgi:hypothetical protein
MRIKWLFLILLLAPIARGANPPTIFFTDLASGANSGGETASGYSGVYVTIYGNNFGASPTVTWNGLNCLRVVPVHGNAVNPWMWYQKLVVQFGSACTTGSGALVVTSGGQASVCEDVGTRGSHCQFTVRSGHIFFVSTSGNDSNVGSFAAPWATMLQARNAMAPGDVTYAENGVAQTTDDGSGWNTYFLIDSQQGTLGNPLALVAYPGATATIGTATLANEIGIRSKGSEGSACSNNNDVGCQSHWVFAGLTLRAHDQAMGPWGDSDWRMVGMDVSCPNGNGQTGCWESTLLTNSVFLGNNLHDAGTAGASSLYQGMYPSSDSNHLEIGWNTVANVLGCRGIQIHSSPIDAMTGYNQFDLSIHDNVIHDTQCDGIILATVDPSKGAILVYNNVIYNAGKGNTPEGSGAWFCVNSPGYTNTGAPGSGNIEVYNNTMYNCGPNPNPSYGGSSGGVGNGGNNANLQVHIRNNIIYDTNSNAPYWVNGSTSSNGVFGDNNIMFGLGVPPASSVITGTINSDPLFASITTPDFHLSSASSPANGAGDKSTPASIYDHDGLSRPSPPSVGAYEFAAGAVVTRPNPPTNLTVTIVVVP